MNFDELLYDSSKDCIDKAADLIGDNEKLIAGLLELTLKEKPKISARAARVINVSFERKPILAALFRRQIIESFENVRNESIRFNLLRIFTFTPLPDDEEDLGMLMNICFDTLDTVTERVAQKAYSLDILANIAMIIPEIKQELALIIRREMPYSSAGYRSRGLKVLKKIGLENYSGMDEFPDEM